MRRLTLSLWSPKFTVLHRAGVTGLYLTLKFLEPYKGKVIDWELSPLKIELSWECPDKEAISWLTHNTYRFRSDLEGLIDVPCLHLDLPQAVHLHNAMTGTFLQHPTSVKYLGAKICQIPLDEHKFLEVKYQALGRYNHQDLQPYAAKGLFDKYGAFEKSIRISQWLYPGGAEKHLALSGRTRLEETPEGFLALLFAPLGCSFYQIRSLLTASKDGKKRKYRWAIVIPHIDDLETFARIKLSEGFQTVPYENYFASGVADASLHHLLTVAATETNLHYQTLACDTWSFGNVPWSKIQTLTRRHSVSGCPEILQLYGLAHQHLSNSFLVGKNGVFIKVGFGRELAAENLVEGKPWYWQLNQILRLNREYLKRLFYERRGLRTMQEDLIKLGLSEDTANLFADAFVWQLSLRFSQAKKQTQGEKPNYKKVKENLLSSIKDCYTQDHFCKLMRQVFSRPSSASNPFLKKVNLGQFYLWCKEHWEDCLNLMVLGIVSYENPWNNPRLAQILEAKGVLKPKYLLDSSSAIEQEEDIEDEEEDEELTLALSVDI